MSDDQYYYCLICGGDDRSAPLELAQVGGGRTVLGTRPLLCHASP